MRPSCLLRAKIIQVCLASSFARSMPRSFALKPAFASLLTAVITKIWLFQTIGLECERAGMFVFQSTFCVFSRSQEVGGFVPSATPDAFGPRNDGQFCALIVNDERARKRTEVSQRFMLGI